MNLTKEEKDIILYKQGAEDFVLCKKNYSKYKKYHAYKRAYDLEELRYATAVHETQRWYLKKMEKQNEYK
tara:strand:+ start:788 stop:997 length:210 start_codon:yes stop_codon:yes gene_type:complete